MELAANIITELMYAQCNVNGTDYLLLEAFDDHRKHGWALNEDDQVTIMKGQETLKNIAKTKRNNGYSILSNL